MFNLIVICNQPIKYSPTVINVLNNLDSKKTIVITKGISETNFDYKFLKRYYLIDADFKSGIVELLIRLIADFIRYRKNPNKSILFRKYDLSSSEVHLDKVFDLIYLQIKGHLLKWVYKKKAIILFDIDSVLFCKNKIHIDSNIVYFDLELRMENDSGWEEKVKLLKEEKIFHKIKKVIIQSEERLSIFKNQYHLANFENFLFPVCISAKGLPNGKLINLHNLLDINKDQKIVVHVGGILEELEIFEMIKEMIKISYYHFVFIGYADSKYLEYINNNLSLEDSNVHFINPNFDTPDELEQLISSSFAGIAWYKDLSLNMTTAVLSSGKIALYTKVGLPVITNNYESFASLLKIYNFGIGISSLIDLNSALKYLEINFDLFSKNSKVLFNQKYNLDYYIADFKKFIYS
jgi:hypothetical protein